MIPSILIGSAVVVVVLIAIATDIILTRRRFKRERERIPPDPVRITIGGEFVNRF